MNPIITELYHALSEIQVNMKKQNIEMKVKEKEGTLYCVMPVDDRVSAMIRIFCRNDEDREVSIEVYGIGKAVQNHIEVLREINEQNCKERWFKVCMNQKSEVFLRRDEDYENPAQIIDVTMHALSMMHQMMPYFKPNMDKKMKGKVR